MNVKSIPNEIPTEPAARRAWIKFQLEVKGRTLAALSRELKLARNTVTTALHRPYPRIEREIARIIGVSAQLIWPERYDEHGQSNRRQGPQTVAERKRRPARKNPHKRAVKKVSA